MKRKGYILTEENLTLDVCKAAIMKASKGKRKRFCVKRALANLDERAQLLRKIILEGEYEPSEYKVCNVVDHPSGKPRVLHKPKFFPDQCVHHVIVLLLKDEFMKRMDHYAIASVPGRGGHYGWKAIRRWKDRDKTNTKYCLKFDVRKCYENIKPEVIMACFLRFIKDKKLLGVISKVAYSLPSLPLGNYTSGWFQNIIMLPVDNAIRKSNLASYFVRYVDDGVAFGSNKRRLSSLVEVVSKTLDKLGLWLKNNLQIFPFNVRGLDFIGYRFFRNYILLRKRNLLSLLRTINSYNNHPTAALSRSLLSRIGLCKWFSSHNFWTKHCLGLNFKRMKRRAYAL